MAALTSAEAAKQALDEFDELGRHEFLAKYGYGPAKRYFVERDGKLYDSKAIYGVAVGYEHPDRGYMRNDEFSGGEGSVLPQLKNLGFEIHDTGVDEDDDELLIPQEEVDAFSLTLGSAEYAAKERNYKVAVHEVVSRLLAQGTHVLAKRRSDGVPARRRRTGGRRELTWPCPSSDYVYVAQQRPSRMGSTTKGVAWATVQE